MHNPESFALQQATEKAQPYKKQIDAALAAVMKENAQLVGKHEDVEYLQRKIGQLELVLQRVVIAFRHGKIDQAEIIATNAVRGG